MIGECKLKPQLEGEQVIICDPLRENRPLYKFLSKRGRGLLSSLIEKWSPVAKSFL